MKLGKAEGTPEEIKGFLEISGESLNDYIERIQPPMENKWVVCPIVCFVLLVVVFVMLPLQPKQIVTTFFLVGFSIGTWLVAAIQLRFGKMAVTGVVAFGALLILLLSAGYLLPKETIEIIKPSKG